jgi:hypothetical protein
MKKVFLLMALLVATFSAFSQVGDYKRKKADVFPKFGEFSRQGWYIMPGVTNTQGFGTRERSQLGADTLMKYSYKPTGALGGFIQFGRFHAPRRGVISYFDYGIDFRLLRGRHNYSAHLSNETEDFNIMAHEGTGRFSEGWLGLNLNATRISQISSKVFITNGLGVNAHVNIFRKAVYTPNPLGLEADIPSIFLAQLHYQFGIGFKVNKRLFIIPTFETPILGLWDFNGGIPSMRYFNTYTQPLLLGVKFMWLSKNRPDKCPTGTSGKQRKEQLFDKNVRKKYRW